MYNWYKSKITQRLAVPTDVTVDVYGKKSGSQTYEMQVTVGIEPGGVAKEMIVHTVQVLDYHPTFYDNRYRNCVRKSADAVTVNLNPGESVTFTAANWYLSTSGDLELDATDWANKGNVRVVAFAQDTGTSAPQEIYNGNQRVWPLQIVGDVDANGLVNLADLSLLLVAYNSCDGDPDYDPACDFDDDDCVGLADLSLLLGNYGYSD